MSAPFLPPSPPVRRILFIDAFDSFTNNIIGMLERCLDVAVTMVRIDDESAAREWDHMIAHFDAVVIGPGPGTPTNPSDVGLINKLWQSDQAQVVPVLGICLGFQSLCINHGATIRRLNQARHGIVSKPIHQGIDIFEGVTSLEATQYHSLHVVLGDGSEVSASWARSGQSPLVPLAWDVSDEANGPVLMAVRHAEKPFWGIQFHPESICTSKEAERLLQNWWARADQWLLQNRQAHKNSIISTNGFISSPVLRGNTNDSRDAWKAENESSPLTQELRAVMGTEDVFLRWGMHRDIDVGADRLVDALKLDRSELVLLDSQGHASGRYSILGFVIPGQTIKVTYSVTDRTLRFGVNATATRSIELGSIDKVWPLLQEALDAHRPVNRRPYSSGASTPCSESPKMGFDRLTAGELPADSPFWGGFMGYFSYEAGLETIDVPCTSGQTPDISLAFVHRSIVIDHQERTVCVQSLLLNDWAWILELGTKVAGLVVNDDAVTKRTYTPAHSSEKTMVDRMLADSRLTQPTEVSYRGKVLTCQDFLASGDSYELCLTDETELRVPKKNRLDPWRLYRRLRQNNPAPFGAYLHLDNVTIVGSSPERFLSWDRAGRCQFRPIKGTVKKGLNMTREKAHEILGTSKERAENLMIVDLIRHDLSGVVGASNTSVPKLMVVEEYETVYQLVSVIEGRLPKTVPEAIGPRGIDVLKASLPPGSMTGAPKKRSCEILRHIERRPRGCYAGVLGYLDIGGGGDFSVVIRTAVRAEQSHTIITRHVNGALKQDSLDSTRHDTWLVGAGGAVTIQSSDEGEYLEMQAKASSVLGALLR